MAEIKDRSLNENINIKESNKLKSAIRFFLSVALIIAAGYAILNYVPFIAKYDSYVVLTGSMVPVINPRDVVIIDTSVSVEDLEAGQIIAFYADKDDDGGEDDVIVHYLYSITYEGDNVIIKTKPEISDSLDDWELTEEDIIGVHTTTIKGIGSILMFATSTIGRIVLIFDLVIIYIVIEMFSGNKDSKNKKTPEIIEKSESNE